MKNKILKATFWLYVIFILLMSFYPTPPEIPTSDKFNHFTAFFVLAILQRISLKSSYLSIFLFGTFLGAFIELVQYFLPYRCAEYGDFVADLFGVLCGMFFIFSVEILSSFREKED